MDQGTKSLWKGVGAGCGLLVLVPVLVVAVVTFRTAMPLRAAARSMAELEARFGAPDAFVPAADGTIPADRLAAFLEVRAALAEPCATMHDLMRPMGRIAAVGDRPEPTGGEVLDTTGDLADVATRITPLIGDFMKRRNRALLDAGMGLGEYSYIYALAYRDRLRDPAPQGEVFSGEQPLPPEVQAALRAMLVHQAGPDADNHPALAAEIVAMERDPFRLPWADALPAAVAASRAPFRDRLEAGFCGGITGIELDRGPRRALRIALE